MPRAHTRGADIAQTGDAAMTRLGAVKGRDLKCLWGQHNVGGHAREPGAEYDYR
jgi:hypothetical protein